MVLILSRSDLERVLDMGEVIHALEDAFKEKADGKAIMPVRSSVSTPSGTWFGVMPAFLGELNSFTTKIVSVQPKNFDRKLPTILASIALNDAESGELVALLEGSYITAMRTGALGGVAAKYLSRKDASSAGIFGAGVQARTQLVALKHVRNITRVLVYDPFVERAKDFSKEMSDKLGLKVDVSSSPSELLDESDIIVTVSTSKEPLFNGQDLKPGTHINAFGNFKPTERELDSETIRRSRVVVDDREAAFAEAGDLSFPINEGVITKDHIAADLGEVITGSKQARSSQEEITLFKSVGLGIQDCAASTLAYKKAVEMGVGTKVSL
jgi:alanine dehydrogenase